MDDDRCAWERQPGETARAYHAFAHFRDLSGGLRSLDKAHAAHVTDCLGGRKRPGRRPARWSRWSAEGAWLARAAEYDAHLDRLAREKFAAELVATRERHARSLQGAQTALLLPVRAVLEAIGNPQTLARLRDRATSSPEGAMALLRLAALAASHLPALIQTERLTRGLTSASLEIEDRRQDQFASRIASDPEATRLAISLLDRLAKPDTESYASPVMGDDPAR